MSSDAPASRSFFVTVLGVTHAPMEHDHNYHLMVAGGAPVAGIVQRVEQMPTLTNPWLVYFAMDDCDVALEKATSTGASVIVPPMDVPPKRFAILKDP
jgi:predicted enzyme related to lactoylglutathione lyase